MKKSIFILMFVTLLQAGLFISVAESGAAESKGKSPVTKAPKKAKSRTLKELIAYAEKHGADKLLGEVQSKDLGFSARPETKKLVYVLSSRPSLHERALWVVYEDSIPTGLIWDDFKSTGKSAERWNYKSSLSGDLERCLHAVISSGDASELDVEIDDEVRKKFSDLVSFFTAEAVSLEPKAVK